MAKPKRKVRGCESAKLEKARAEVIAASSAMKDAMRHLHYLGNEAIYLRDQANRMIESVKGYEAITTLAITHIRNATNELPTPRARKAKR